MKKMELTLEVHENILEFKTNIEVDIKAEIHEELLELELLTSEISG